MIRLFVGLSLPGGVAARLRPLCIGLAGARWVDSANMHITLRFIGEIDELDAVEIDERLSNINADLFDLELRGFGTFGHKQKIRALWAGVSPSPPLAHLQAKVESAVVRSGQPPGKRKFTPHVTLARFARCELSRLESFIAGNNLFQAGPFQVGHFTLFVSSLGKGGPIYTPLTTYELS
jgi:RNA 2',3'-cyclic 3'-phosphodiesterase